MIAAFGWQDAAALAAAVAGVLFALWLRRRCGGGHDCRRCARGARQHDLQDGPARR